MNIPTMKMPTLKIPDLEIPKMVKSLNRLEIGILVLFAIYLVAPIQTPAFLIGVVDSPLGMLVLFILTIYMFLKINPIIAVVFILVAYELLRRSSSINGKQTVIQYTPTQAKKDAEMKSMNPPKKDTLEEEIVDKMAPIGRSEVSTYTSSTFKPVADKLEGASML